MSLATRLQALAISMKFHFLSLLALHSHTQQQADEGDCSYILKMWSVAGCGTEVAYSSATSTNPGGLSMGAIVAIAVCIGVFVVVIVIVIVIGLLIVAVRKGILNIGYSRLSI